MPAVSVKTQALFCKLQVESNGLLEYHHSQDESGSMTVL